MHPWQKPKKRLGSGIRLVGAQVANFRRAEGLTQRELAERLRVSEQLVASIEQARRPLKRDLAELMDQLLDAKGALEVLVDNLSEIDSYPVWAMEFIGLEREAIALSSGASPATAAVRTATASRSPPAPTPSMCATPRTRPWAPLRSAQPHGRPSRRLQHPTPADDPPRGRVQQVGE
jgi:transcriptional regulator with XRE-family HTH domain